MVKFVNLGTGTAVAQEKLVIELVGLAGAGKTTLTNALMQQNHHFSNKIVLPRTQVSQHLLAHTRAFLPTYLRHFPRLRWFTREEMRTMIYLTAWPDFLSSQGDTRRPVQLLDLGPVYRLAFLQEFGSPMTKQLRFAQWCDQIVDRWQSMLDILIWLDAPNAVLVDRINARHKAHAVKARSTDESEQFFTRYRTGYEKIINQLATSNGPAILRFDTSQFTLNQILEQVTSTLQQYRQSAA